MLFPGVCFKIGPSPEDIPNSVLNVELKVFPFPGKTVVEFWLKLITNTT